jgi:hypothetical protein
MLFKEIIAVYVENHTKPVIKSIGLLNVETLGICSYHLALKD